MTDAKSCKFCNYAPDKMIASNDLAFIIKDINPVSDGHLLLIPRRHAVDYFDLLPHEITAIHELLFAQKTAISTR